MRSIKMLDFFKKMTGSNRTSWTICCCS